MFRLNMRFNVTFWLDKRQPSLPFVANSLNRRGCYLSGVAQVEFDWRMEFNGWTASKTEEWDEDLFPSTIDSIVVGYTNPRSYTSLKLLRVA
jgi:hypothetical protein